MLGKFKNSDFLKNSFTLIAGTALVNFIPLLFQPLLRSVYDVEDFGAMSVYTSLLSIAIAVYALRYPLAIYLPSKLKDSFSLVVLSWLIALFFTITTFLFLVLYAQQFAVLIKFPTGYVFYLFLLPFSIFLFSTNDTLNHWFIRNNLILNTIKVKFTKRFVEPLFALLLGHYGFRGGLFWSELIAGTSQTIAALLLGKKTFLFKKISKTRILKQGKLYKDYPLYNSLPALLNTLSLGLPIIIINAKYNAEITGYFDLTKMVLAVPISLISMSLAKIILQKFAEKFREEQPIQALFSKITISLIATSGLIILLILTIGPFLFDLFFGDKWRLSSDFAQILVFGFAIKLVVSPLSSILNSINKIKLVSVWQVFYFILILILAKLSLPNIYDFLKLYVIIDLVAYLVYFSLILFAVKKHDSSLITT